MRAVHIGQAHEVDDIRIVRKECASLAEAGIDAVYITQKKDKVYKGEKICGVSVYTYEPHKVKIPIPFISPKFGRYLSRRRALKLALEMDGEIYHIHELCLWLVGKKLKRSGKKLIFDQHEDSPGQVSQIYLEKFHNKFVEFFFRRIAIFQEKSIVKSSDLVIATSEMIADNIKKYQLNDNIIVIHNYANKNVTLCNTSDYLEREKRVCYAGGLFERRGIQYVIEAMSKVNGMFEFAGELHPKLYQYYRNSKGWSKCKYLGSISRDEVNRLYERSRIGIINNLDLPYHRNSNPNKLFEYMAAGLPIVCTSISAWADIVNHAGCGLVVEATNTEEIARAINFLLDNPEIARQMGQNGYQAFISTYNWDLEKEKLINEYRKVVSG